MISKLTAKTIYSKTNILEVILALRVLWYFRYTWKKSNYYHKTGNIHLFTSTPTLLKPNLFHVPTLPPATSKFTKELENEIGRCQIQVTYPHATYWLFFETAMHFPSKEPSSSNLCRHFLLLTSQMKTSPSSGCRIK